MLTRAFSKIGSLFVAVMFASASSVTVASTTVPDVVQLQELTNQHLTGVYAVPTQPQITVYAINSTSKPPYALVDWGVLHGGGEFVATNKLGKWTYLFGSGGIYSTAELVQNGVPSAVATYLKANMQPLSTP
jgi:hypothetical protein